MNKNTKGRFNQAKRNRAKGDNSSTFEVPKILSGIGESANWGTYGSKTFNFKSMPRLSKKPKVCAKGQRTQFEIAQNDIEDATNQEIAKIVRESRDIVAPKSNELIEVINK